MPTPFQNLLIALLIALPCTFAQREIALVQSSDVTSESVSKLKDNQFKGVAVVLDDQSEEEARRTAARLIEGSGLELYWWIEVGRNPKMATANPRWMASLGSHADWQKRFPGAAEPGVNQVAKAFPWVPIVYAEAYDAHLARIEQLLRDLPRGNGVLLNDLQAGPGSCGCGNVQCRWAVDYHVSPTTRKTPGENIAGRFVAEVQKRTGITVIPIWTTECEEADMPSEKNRGKPSTGLCGSVGCATGACPREFSGQLSELLTTYEGPVGFLAVHTPLERTRAEFGGGPAWVINVVNYVHQTLAAEGAKPLAKERVWVVVEGGDVASEKAARESAKRSGASTVIVARTGIEQSYEPRLINMK